MYVSARVMAAVRGRRSRLSTWDAAVGWLLALGLLSVGLLSRLAVAAEEELRDPQLLFNSGQYAECIREAEKGVAAQPWRESWRYFRLRSEMETGQYAAALATLTEALERYPANIRLRLVGRDVYRFNNRPLEAEAIIAKTAELVEGRNWQYAGVADRVMLGRYFLLRGADARQVLETCYDRAKKDQPDFADAYLAAGELALAKHDYALAAEAFQTAAKITPDDPAVHCGLARSYAESDPQREKKALARALELNPNHAESLARIADGLIDAEQQEDAAKILDRMLQVNPRQPEACAYQAVLAHLQGDAEAEAAWRRNALHDWPANPAVDHLIGRKLSQYYRFAEGASRQRQSLRFDPTYLPARIQLSQDLLRLGQEEEGWRLADEVYRADRYDVVAHNLTALREHLSGFKTLSADGLTLRLDPREAEIYGGLAMELLQQARRELCVKYEVQLEGPVLVEFFPQQKDFAIRTLGLPGGHGLLGVCFGSVITVNSPASRGEQTQNWHAVLWHEFCHAVTLHKTRNKMPRWLSEGISVYEEAERNPAWGQPMTAAYRKKILDGGLVPVSRLSGAFLNPATPLDLQFAYYESALVVEFLVRSHGLKTLRQVLADLAEGAPINRVLQHRVGPLASLDRRFAAFARERAEQLAAEADFAAPDLPPQADLNTIAQWSGQHPNNLAGLHLLAAGLIQEKRWPEAKLPLERLLQLHPKNTGPDNPYLPLARVHRELGETEAERTVLEKLAASSADAVDAYVRLAAIYRSGGDWPKVANNAERMLAVNPLVPWPHRALADAADALHDSARAIRPLRCLLQMDPGDPADLHFRLARALKDQGDSTAAKRHVLMALEEAPRFREAQRLLLELVEGTVPIFRQGTVPIFRGAIDVPSEPSLSAAKNGTVPLASPKGAPKGTGPFFDSDSSRENRGTTEKRTSLRPSPRSLKEPRP